jgi:cell division septation protein DedD
MAKYPRKGNGILGLDRTKIVWTAVGAILLVIGSFVAGQYYGYSQGYRDGFSEAQAEQDQSGGPPQRAERGASERKQNDDFEKVITDEDLDGAREQDSAGTEDRTDVGTTSSEQDQTRTTSSDMQDKDDQNQTESQSLTVEGGGLSEGPPEDSVQTSENQETDEESSAEATGSPTSEEQIETSARMVESGGTTFSLQVLSVTKEERARQRVQELRDAGYEAALTTATINGQDWYRVRIGEFSTREEAQSRADALQDEGVIDDYWISQIGNE